MAVITISREFGNNGDKVTKGISEALNMPIVDKETLNTLLSQYGMVSFKEFYDTDHSFMDRFFGVNEDYVRLLNQAIQTYARQDNLIIQGRGGFAILQGFCNVINVLIKTPFEKRVKNAMESEGIEDLAAAEKLVEQHDRIRNGFLQAYYGVKAEDASKFDLVIDTSIVPVEMAVRWICEMAVHLDTETPTEFCQATSTIKLDSNMVEAARKSLNREV